MKDPPPRPEDWGSTRPRHRLDRDRRIDRRAAAPEDIETRLERQGIGGGDEGAARGRGDFGGGKGARRKGLRTRRLPGRDRLTSGQGGQRQKTDKSQSQQTHGSSAFGQKGG